MIYSQRKTNTKFTWQKKTILAVIKTKSTAASVEDFINAITVEQKRNDSFVFLKMMQNASGHEPILWRNSIIGFGIKRYNSPTTGREVNWLLTGFAPRQTNLSLCLMMNVNEQTDTLKKLGKHKNGVGCLNVNKPEAIDLKKL